ncbi:cupin domain-containing protein [Agrobacterium sp. LMR679]|uniref:cupin domain-containing protein n=1 Tax=Agrobacterium sp. LMR679 TaxID=3014335 RepID=UPI0022AEB76B|nr:cupin domain-containing protein [Agrobacterium sp. LMR679]MCZ4072135.1 cupin domain-containing protein [Agrobacterium sp. LMR679]
MMEIVKRISLSACFMLALLSPATAHDPKGTVISPDEGERLVRRWGYSFLMKLDEKNGGAKQFVVGSEILPPGKSVHVHKHDYAEELLIINSGRGTAILGDRKEPVGPGDIVFIPQYSWAGLDNTGTENIDFLWLFPKPGIEKYFRDTSVPDGQEPKVLSDEELDRIRALHSEFVTYRDEDLKDYTASSASD